MPSRGQRLVYWDSNVFLAFINGEPGADQVEALWDEIASNPDDRIITSSIIITEVAFAEAEKRNRSADPQVLARIDNMWRDPSLQLVDVTAGIARLARDLVRAGVLQGWSLKPLDAIHLATAAWVDQNISRLSAFYTFEPRLRKYQALTNIPVEKPAPTAPQLPLDFSGQGSPGDDATS